MNARSPSDTKGSNLRTRLREATNAAILEAAEAVFSEQGVHATSMNEIAARAGVAVGTLYNHFKDKDALIQDLFEMRREGLLDIVDEHCLRPGPGDFRAQLLSLVTAMFDYFERNRRFYVLLFEQAHEYSPLARKATMMKQLTDKLDKLMRRGLKERVLKPELASFYPALLIGMLRATGIHANVCGATRDLVTPAQLVELFLHGAGA
jgi:AcrR family transcriptional regulator